jgi:hypothetical protein
MAWSFGNRHDILRTRMREVNNRTITYRRGGRSAELTATVYEWRSEEKVAYGVPLAVRHVDYIIDNDELIAAVGNPWDGPLQGDEITDSEVGIICQVVPIMGEQCFKYTTSRRGAYRVHTHVIEET